MLINPIDRPPHLQRVPQIVQPPLARDGELAAELLLGDGPLVVQRFALRGLVAGVVVLRGAGRRGERRVRDTGVPPVLGACGRGKTRI